MAKSDEDKQKAATRASLELFMFNTEREKNKDDKAKRLKELEAEVANLKKEANTNLTKINKLEEEKKKMATTNTTLKSDLECQEKLVKEKDAYIASFEEEISNLTLQVEELKLEKTSGWQAEKNKLKEKSFEEGVQSYYRTFLAVEPDYDWSVKFGTGLADWIADLAQKDVEAITKKIAEL